MKLKLSRSTRDALYRYAVVNGALSNAESGHNDGELGATMPSPRMLTVELATILYPPEDMHVASTIINGAVAARIRNILLTCVASNRQWLVTKSPHEEISLKANLEGLFRILKEFPLDATSAETDMLRTSLKTSFLQKDRDDLLYIISTNEGRSGARALLELLRSDPSS